MFGFSYFKLVLYEPRDQGKEEEKVSGDKRVEKGPKLFSTQVKSRYVNW